MIKKPLWQLAIVAFAVVAAVVLLFLPPRELRLLENASKDLMLRMRGEAPKDARILIVDIDEKSLKQLGQWPWSRNILAKMVDNLTRAEVAAIGMDVIFAEPDRSSPHRIGKEFAIEQPLPNYDAQFAQSIANSPTVTGYIFAFSPDGVPPDQEPQSRALIVERQKPKRSFIPTAYRPILNIKSIEQSAFSSGFLNNVPDFDGVVRSVPSAVMFDGILYPSLSIEMLRLVLGVQQIVVQYNQNGVEYIALGDIQIPTDIYGHIRVNYRGKSPAYRYISAVDIYQNNIPTSELAGNIVLLGTSSAGLYDLRSSPFDAVLPGVEVHANLIDNILNQNFIAKPQWAFLADILSIVLLGIVMWLVLMINRLLWSLLAFLVVLLLIFGIHDYLLLRHGVILTTMILIIEAVLIYSIGTLLNYLFEYRQKEWIKDKFAKKVSKEVMEDIVNHADNVSLTATAKEVSIFFSDIRGFTTIAEEMRSPQKLVEFLNAYMTPMTEIIIAHKGTVDKFIGDAIMAYWNAPKALLNHADCALQAAIAQVQMLGVLNQQFAKNKMPQVNIGIGLNAGVCIVGEMGSAGRSDYTCIGDSVNLAARLEGLNKKYHTHIICSQFFVDKLQDKNQYQWQNLGVEHIIGKHQQVQIYSCQGYADAKLPPDKSS